MGIAERHFSRKEVTAMTTFSEFLDTLQGTVAEFPYFVGHDNGRILWLTWTDSAEPVKAYDLAYAATIISDDPFEDLEYLEKPWQKDVRAAINNFRCDSIGKDQQITLFDAKHEPICTYHFSGDGVVYYRGLDRWADAEMVMDDKFNEGLKLFHLTTEATKVLQLIMARLNLELTEHEQSIFVTNYVTEKLAVRQAGLN